MNTKLSVLDFSNYFAFQVIEFLVLNNHTFWTIHRELPSVNWIISNRFVLYRPAFFLLVCLFTNSLFQFRLAYNFLFVIFFTFNKIGLTWNQPISSDRDFERQLLQVTNTPNGEVINFGSQFWLATIHLSYMWKVL